MTINQTSAASARAHHETQFGRVFEQLQRGPIRRVIWERRNPGARLAPSIDVLRNRLGFKITGDGSWDDPYTLRGFSGKRELTPDVYLAYLQTEHWKRARHARMTFDGFQCVQCGSPRNLVVHHWRYNLFAEEMQDLCTYCETCHAMIHKRGCKGPPGCIPLSDYHRICREVGPDQTKPENKP